jgi:hypothetical protein
MASKFTKGQRVKVIHDFDASQNNLVGLEGIIVKLNDDPYYRYEVHFTNDALMDCIEAELESLEATPENAGFMDKLTTFARKVVDPDLRNMIKVGWLDNSLELTEEGKQVLLAEYFFDNKEKIGKLAADQLKENKKDKGDK